MKTIRQKISGIADRVKPVCNSKRGEMFVGLGMKILIGVVLGSLLLFTTYALTNDVVMPTAKAKVEGLMNYSHGSGAEVEEANGCATFSDGAVLSWEDLMLPENGSHYDYAADKITETYIESNAFSECTQLTDIVIQSGVTGIGNYAFANCLNLKTVSMPDSVGSIGNNAFTYCVELREINISSGVTSLQKGVFKECAKLESITIPDTVSTIGQEVFMYCYKLENITLSSNLLSIDYMAFYDTPALKEIHFPASITTLKWGAFMDASITDFYYPGTIAQWNALDKNNWDYHLDSYTVHCADGTI